MQLTTVGPVDVGGLDAALREAVGTIETDLRLAIAFLPIEAPHAAILRTIKSVVDVPLVGASTGGGAFTERGCTTDGIVVGFISGENTRVSARVATGLGADCAGAVREAIESFDSVRSRHLGVMTLADAFATDGEALVDALRSATPLFAKHFGGTAGDNWTFAGTKVFLDEQVLQDAAVVTAFYADKPMVMGVRHGWCVAEGAKELLVTKTDANKIVELDGRPALEVYSEELVRLGLLAAGADPVPTMATYELGAVTPFGKEFKIRAPLGAEDGAVILASAIPERSYVRVMTTDHALLIEAAADLHAEVTEKLDATSGMLVFDCAARQRLLGDDWSDQVIRFTRAGHPTLGMTCYGEIARFRGSVEGFHNTTDVVVAF